MRIKDVVTQEDYEQLNVIQKSYIRSIYCVRAFYRLAKYRNLPNQHIQKPWSLLKTIKEILLGRVRLHWLVN